MTTHLSSDLTEDWKQIQTHIGIHDPAGRPGPVTVGRLKEALGIGVSSVSDAMRPTAPSGGSLPELVARQAEGQIGVREEGGNNIGPAIVQYQKATWLPPGPWPWCAAFVCWCVQHALHRTGNEAIHRPQTAGAWDFEKWATGKHGPTPGVLLQKPRPSIIRRGDIVVFTFSHIGIAVSHQNDSDSLVQTVEGNTDTDGTREGDGVFKKNRKPKQIRSIIRLP